MNITSENGKVVVTFLQNSEGSDGAFLANRVIVNLGDYSIVMASNIVMTNYGDDEFTEFCHSIFFLPMQSSWSADALPIIADGQPGNLSTLEFMLESPKINFAGNFENDTMDCNIVVSDKLKIMKIRFGKENFMKVVLI